VNKFINGGIVSRMVKVNVRNASESDILDLVHVHRTDFSKEELQYFGGSFFEMSKVFADVEMDSFKRMIHKPSFRKDWWLVAEKDDQVVGEVRGYPSWSKEMGNFLFLVNLIVHRNFRGRGIGSQIINKVSERAGKAGYSALVTTPEDIDGPVHNFYAKNNFKDWFSFDRMSCEAREIEFSLHYTVKSTTIEETRNMTIITLPSYVLEREIKLSLEASENDEGDCFVIEDREKTIGCLLLVPFFPEQNRLTMLLKPEYVDKDKAEFLLSVGMNWINKHEKKGAVVRVKEEYKDLFRSFGFVERQKGLFMIRELEVI